MTNGQHAGGTARRPSDGAPAGATAPRLRVLLPLPLAGAYDYRRVPGESLSPGDYVRVPFGRREMSGVVWDGAAPDGADRPVAEERLRDVVRRHDAPPMPAVHRRFLLWVADYTVSPAGAVLRQAMSVPAALEPAPDRVAFGPSPDGAGDVRLTRARRRVLDLLRDTPPLPGAELARLAGVTPSVVTAMARAGLLAPVPVPGDPPPPAPDPRHARCALSAAQRAALAELEPGLAREAGFSTTLIDGVTGSGKTELYMEAVAQAVADGGQALVLLPEIALSDQVVGRFAARFGAPPVLWHSEVGAADRRRGWRWVAEGRARIVVGARSALFLPFPDLRLIVVDEEHDQAYKQMDGVAYQARDMAVARGHLGGIPVLLASATPSLETVVNVEADRYRRVVLPLRHGGAGLPEARVIDLRREPPEPGRWLAPPLVSALADALGREAQAMLFLNRRGYAPLSLCGACGFRLECPNCSAWLVEHRLAGRLQCHHCGYGTRLPRACPECGAEDSIVACGPGVERIAEEVLGRFPDARFAIVTSDTVGGPSAAAELFRSIRDHEVDIVIGTQVVAKGHHFPDLTLVGVVDADLGLSGGDLRAAERTYQLVHQVAGRAGRADRPGIVMIQTREAAHPVIAALASGARDRFLAAEAAARRHAGMPPYGRLAALIVSGHPEAAVVEVARALGRAAPQRDGVRVLGPAPAPLALLRGRHRQRLLLVARRDVAVQPVLRDWLAKVQGPGTVRVQIDVDPYAFL